MLNMNEEKKIKGARRRSVNPAKSFARGMRRTAGLVVFALLAIFGAALVYAHGAWLNRPNIRYSPATDAQIAANIAAGNSAIMPNDIIELIAEFPSIVDGTLSGPNGYFTFYVPAGTEVVGASVVNASFADIPVRNATSAVSGEGISRGWGPQGQRTFNVTAGTGWNPLILPSGCSTASPTAYSAATCNSGLAHVYGDTGIFYSTRADTAFYTGDGTEIASLTNGYQIAPSNTAPWSSIGGSGSARVHNKWDAVQSNAFGSSGPLINPGFSTQESTRVNTTGRGTTPYRAGSPVAGPQTGNNLDRYGTTGPWNRIIYPGSCYARDGQDGPANGSGSVSPNAVNNTPNSIAICGAPPGGTFVGEASPLPSGAGGVNAVRYAIGGIDQGQTYRIKIRLRALNPALIKGFNAEAAGGDSTQGAKAGNDNPWRYFVGGPGVAAPASSGVLGIKKLIVAVNGSPYIADAQIPPNATVRYRITYSNTGLTAHTNVQLSDFLPTQSTATSNFTVISGSNILPTSPATPTTGTFTFTTIPTLDVAQGGTIEFNVTLTASVGQTVTNTGRISSTQRPTALTSAATATVRPSIANLLATKTSYVYDPTNQNRFSLPGADMVYSITITNAGDPISSNTLTVTDIWPSYLSFSLYPFDGSTSEPVKFVDGSGQAVSGVSCCTASQILYSTDNGVTFTYINPSSAYLNNVTHVRVTPTGQMNAGSSSQTSFSLLLRGQIK